MGMGNVFEELSLFVQDSSRHLGNCSERYTRYASERMVMCVEFVSRLKQHIQDRLDSVSHQNRSNLNYYVRELESLTFLLTLLCQQWLRYLDIRERLSVSIAYRAPSENSSRPCFTVTTDQLIYLQSLHFHMD